LCGKGTKISKYLINHDKIYEAEIKLGAKTDTLDREGEILERRAVEQRILEKQNIEKVLEKFIGKQEQIPPIYSAIKVKGKKLYEYARKGQTVEIEPRKIEIYKITLQEIQKEENQIKFEGPRLSRIKTYKTRNFDTRYFRRGEYFVWRIIISGSKSN